MFRLWQRTAGAVAAAAILAAGAGAGHAQAKKSIIIAEPVHNLGYLPLYVAIRKGYLAEDGIDVKILTVETGAGHTNAVLSGQAFAFIGGPEHDAFAKLKGAELRAVVNCVDRGNVYLMAAKGAGPKPGQSMAEYVKGKSIAVGQYGGTPNSILLYLLKLWKLDAKTDVSLQEMAYSAVIAGVKSGRAVLGVAAEPYMTRGIEEGIWEGPVVNVPKELGPYAYSVINVRGESVKSDADTVRKLVRAVMRGLKFTYADPEEATKVAKLEFPTMAVADLKATLDREFADQIWSKDGMISEASWKTAENVVLEAGILKKPVPYADIIDMQFVKELQSSIR